MKLPGASSWECFAPVGTKGEGGQTWCPKIQNFPFGTVGGRRGLKTNSRQNLRHFKHIQNSADFYETQWGMRGHLDVHFVHIKAQSELQMTQNDAQK